MTNWFGRLRAAAMAIAVAAAVSVAMWAPAHEDIDWSMVGDPDPENWAEIASHEGEVDVPSGPAVDHGQRRDGAGPALNVRRQPQGVLSGRVVYTSGGHGWNGTPRTLDRPFLLGMNEDYGNADQIVPFAQYLFNAGATVVPLRPLGRQPNAVTLDQDDTAMSSAGIVTYTGAWTPSNSTPYYVKLPDSEGYRFSNAVTGAPTATARYTPNIPQAGYYPVYTWVLNSGNRINQEYLIKHAGGVSSVRVPHNLVGRGFVWLGTYWFDAGMNGYVEITNSRLAGDTGTVVIADAIRFGNGIGADNRPRDEEGNRHWGADVNQFPGTVTSSNVSAPPRGAAHMNIGPFGKSVYVGFHSNAAGGRGAVGLHNNSAPSPNMTPNQIALATILGREINEDFRQLDTIEFPFYPEWNNRTTHTYSSPSINYGEITGSAINNEMDATIIEVAFHDNASDVEYMRDARGRRLLARSTMQGVVRYFNQFDGGALIFPPDEPRNPRAQNATDGSNDIILTWEAPIVRNSAFAGTPGPIGGHAPSRYAIYTSLNGRDFQFHAETPNATTTYRVTGFPRGTPVFFHITGVNAGGESFPSPVAGARVHGGRPAILIVDGYDRMHNSITPNQVVSGGGTTSRIFPRQINDYSYVIQTGQAIAGASDTHGFDSAPNDAVISGAVNLNDYDAVIWFLGRESTLDETFSSTEQARVTTYLNNGGNLFVSGSEIGFDLWAQGNAADRSFLNNLLKTAYGADSANSYNASGVAGTIFEGISLQFDNGTFGHYNVNSPDVLNPSGGSVTAMRYHTGTSAAIHYDGAPDGRGQVIVLGFPFEMIVNSLHRELVMTSVLEAFFTDDSPVSIGTWTFESSAEGWQFRTIDGLKPPLDYSTPGQLQLNADGDNTNTYGYYVSPAGALAIQAFDPMADDTQAGALFQRQGPHYLVRYWLRRTTIDATKEAHLRLRVNSSTFEDYHTLELISHGDGSHLPSDIEFTPVDMLFHPHPYIYQLSAGQLWYYISFDLLNFDPTDSLIGGYVLDRVEVFRVPLAVVEKVATVRRFDFLEAADRDAWQFYEVPGGIYDAPTGRKTANALEMFTDEPQDVYGNFQNLPFTITANAAGQTGKLFVRMRSRASATEQNPLKVPHMRFRLMPLNFTRVATAGVVDEGPATFIPSGGNPRVFTTFIEVPEDATTWDLHAAWDYLSFETFDSEEQRQQRETSPEPVSLTEVEIDLVRVNEYPEP